MSFFNQGQKDLYPDNEQEVLLIDRLVEGINKVLIEEKTTDLHKIKSALSDTVVLTKLLTKLGISFELTGSVKDIRDSLAHVDERLDKFDFQPTTISGAEWAYEEADDKFKLSKSYNFQGAISMARVSTDGTIKAVSPSGMIDDIFLWIDRKGKQQHIHIEQIRVAYLKIVDSAAENLKQNNKTNAEGLLNRQNNQ